MAAAISRRKGVSESKAILARSSPAASETLLMGLDGISGRGSDASARGSLDAAMAAAPPSNDVFRKLLRDLWHPVDMVRTSSDFGQSIRLESAVDAGLGPTGVIWIT
jgi:hypothetical protein